jgi:hypothetical protein
MNKNNLTFLVIERYFGNGWFCFLSDFFSVVLLPGLAFCICPFNRMYALKPRNPE